MLSDWVRVQKSTVEQCKQYEEARSIISPLSLACSDFWVESWAGAKHSRIPKNFFSPYLLTDIADLLIGSVPQSQPINVFSISTDQLK